MTAEELSKFPDELQKALAPKYRLLHFEFHTAPLLENAQAHLRILIPGEGVWETRLPMHEFEAPTDYLIRKVLEDLRRIPKRSSR